MNRLFDKAVERPHFLVLVAIGKYGVTVFRVSRLFIVVNDDLFPDEQLFPDGFVKGQSSGIVYVLHFTHPPSRFSVTLIKPHIVLSSIRVKPSFFMRDALKLADLFKGFHGA